MNININIISNLFILLKTPLIHDIKEREYIISFIPLLCNFIISRNL